MLQDTAGLITGPRRRLAGADAGLHLVIWLNGVARDREAAFTARAWKASLGIHPITPFYAPISSMDRREVAGLVMGYAGVEEPDIERGVRVLQEVFRAFAGNGT